MKIKLPLPRVFGVLAVAYLAFTLARPGALADPLRDLAHADDSLNLSAKTFWMTASNLPWLLAPLLAFLSDIVPLGKIRRRSWLLLATGAAILLWLALAGVPQKYSTLLAVQLSLSFAFVVFQTSKGGLAADLGQAQSVTGAVSGICTMAINAGTLLLLALGPTLAERGLAWIAMFSAGVLLAFGVFAVRALTIEPRAPTSIPKASVAFREMFSSRSFWLSGLLFFLLGAASEGMATYVKLASMWKRSAPSTLTPAPLWVSPAAILLAGAAYLWLCRRLALRRLLLGAVGLTIVALSVTFATAAEDYFLGAGRNSILIGIASIPLMDLAFRAVQPGLEALGLTLLQCASVLGVSLSSALCGMFLTSLQPTAVQALFFAVSIAGVIPVLLLPSALVRKREGESWASSSGG